MARQRPHDGRETQEPEAADRGAQSVQGRRLPPAACAGQARFLLAVALVFLDQGGGGAEDRREGEKQKAIRLLRQIDGLKNEMYDDQEVRKEAGELLKELED